MASIRDCSTARELAKRTGKFGWQHLKAALHSSPLLGAGRVEDTFNLILIGRALSTVVHCAAKALYVSVAGRLKPRKSEPVARRG